MRRADRLFEIIQLLRRHKLLRAQDMAERLEVSERTVYRDIRDLMATGVPIEGEAGVGYVLRKGYDLPPLMFTADEVEAMALGARIVESWADAGLADAAANALSKIETVVSDSLKQRVQALSLIAPEGHFAEPIAIDTAGVRQAVRDKKKLQMVYRDAAGAETERTVRPLTLAFFGPVWLLVGWCELRQDFRSFRLDRIAVLDVLDERFRNEAGKTLNDYLKAQRERC